MMIRAAESNTRVDPLHTRKMAARMQAASASERPILMWIETQAGHAGTPRCKILDELTDNWALVFQQLGVSMDQ